MKIQSQWLEAKYLLSQSSLRKNKSKLLYSLSRPWQPKHPFDHGDAVLSALIQRSQGSETLSLVSGLWASYPYSKYTKHLNQTTCIGNKMYSSSQQQKIGVNAHPSKWAHGNRKRSSRHAHYLNIEYGFCRRLCCPLRSLTFQDQFRH